MWVFKIYEVILLASSHLSGILYNSGRWIGQGMLFLFHRTEITTNINVALSNLQNMFTFTTALAPHNLRRRRCREKGQERGRVESCSTFQLRTQIPSAKLSDLPPCSRKTSIPVESCVYDGTFTWTTHALSLSSLHLRGGMTSVIGEFGRVNVLHCFLSALALPKVTSEPTCLSSCSLVVWWVCHWKLFQRGGLELFTLVSDWLGLSVRIG